MVCGRVRSTVTVSTSLVVFEGVVGGDDLERPGAVGRDRARDRVGGGRVDADRGLRAAGGRRALEELDLGQVGVGAGSGDREGIRGGGVDDPDRRGDVDRGRVVVDAAVLDERRRWWSCRRCRPRSRAGRRARRRCRSCSSWRPGSSTCSRSPARAGTVIEARPEPPSFVVEVRVTVPERSAPGLSIVAVGAVLSTRTVIVAEVNELPAMSVVMTRRSYWPSACAVVSQLAAWFVQMPAAIGERWNWTVATPEPRVGGAARQARRCRGRWPRRRER